MDEGSIHVPDPWQLAPKPRRSCMPASGPHFETALWPHARVWSANTLLRSYWLAGQTRACGTGSVSLWGGKTQLR